MFETQGWRPWEKDCGNLQHMHMMCWGGYNGEYIEKEDGNCRDEGLRTIALQRVNEGRESQRENKFFESKRKTRKLCIELKTFFLS